jgi:hypothetical protein
MANWLDNLIATGASGVNSVWLKRAADAGLIKPGMSADEIHRAVAGMASPAPVRQMQLPLQAPEDEIRALIPYGGRGPGVPVGQPRGTGMSGDRVAAHNELRDSWPVAYDADESEVLDAMSEFSPEQRQYLQALQSNDWLGFDYPSQAASAGLASPNAASRWEMSPDLVAARQSLMNSRLRGPGVAMPAQGGAMIPAPMRGLPAPAQPRIGTTAGVPVDRNPGDDVNMFGMSESSLDEPLSAADQQSWNDMVRQWDQERPFTFDRNGQLTMSPRGLELARGGRKALPAPAQKALPAPASTAMRDQQAVDGIASQFDNMMGGRAPTEDLQLAPYGYSGSRAASAAPAPGGMPAWAKAAAGAGLIGAGATAYNMMPKGMRSTESEAVGELDSTDGTADLVEESRPAPKVEAPPVSPRDQAQALIAKLNKMRRDAGGEVPEAPQMMKEINRLMAMSNQSRNAMTPQQAQGSSDPHIKAQALIAQLNQMRQQAGGEVPQAQQMMAEVRRLQAMGDQQRNYAQTR